MFDDLIEFTIGYDSASDSLVFTSTVDGTKQYVSMGDIDQTVFLDRLDEINPQDILSNR